MNLQLNLHFLQSPWTHLRNARTERGKGDRNGTDLPPGHNPRADSSCSGVTCSCKGSCHYVICMASGSIYEGDAVVSALWHKFCSYISYRLSFSTNLHDTIILLGILEACRLGRMSSCSGSQWKVYQQNIVFFTHNFFTRDVFHKDVCG